MRYPKNRKTSIRHRVKTHTRNGKTVRSYSRGKGARRRSVARASSRTIAKEGSSRKTMEDYKVVFHYANKTKEMVPTAARDADDALSLAMKKRKRKRLKPVKIEVIDGLGAILGTIVGKVAGGIASAAQAFRAQRAKGASEREAQKQVREMSIAERDKLREEFATTQLAKARAGDRAAQIWCEKHHIAWEQV